MCFYLKMNWIHMSCPNFSWVRIFCDGNHSKLVPESTRPGGFPSWIIVYNLHKKLKSEDLLFKKRYVVLNVILYSAGYNLFYMVWWIIYSQNWLIDYLHTIYHIYKRSHGSFISNIQCYIISSWLQYFQYSLVDNLQPTPIDSLFSDDFLYFYKVSWIIYS